VKIAIAKVDVSNREEVFNVADEIRETALHPDIIVLNAGIVRGKNYIQDKSELDVRKCFEVNVYQLFWFAQAFLPLLYADKTKEKKVITIASSAGMGANPRLIDYCSSKYAAMGFGEGLQLELEKQQMTHVKTSLVCPFFIRTGMFDGISTGTLLGKLFGMTLLEEDYVVETIIQEGMLGSTDHIAIPKLIYLVPIMKALFPHKMRVFLSKALGAFDAMDSFKAS